jgi:hypothetical protein
MAIFGWPFRKVVEEKFLLIALAFRKNRESFEDALTHFFSQGTYCSLGSSVLNYKSL